MTTEVVRWIRQDFYFTSIELYFAYFAIPLQESEAKYTRFRWRDIVYEYLTVMFGLGPSIRIFTKLMAAVIRFLRTEFGMLIVAYINDLLIQARDEQTCRLHAEIVILQDLGYGVNFGKSSLVPSKTVEHLGFVWNSNKMLVSLPQVKIKKIISRAKLALEKNGMTAGDVRLLLGSLESLRLATTLALIHFCGLQYMKPRPRRRHDLPVKKWLQLSPAARSYLLWWAKEFHHTAHTSSSLVPRSVTMELWTDASGLVGWGGNCSRGGKVQGCWTSDQLPWQINLKEILAAQFSLEALMKDGDVVNLYRDSQVAVAFVNRMGGARSTILCAAALEF